MHRIDTSHLKGTTMTPPHTIKGKNTSTHHAEDCPATMPDAIRSGYGFRSDLAKPT
ncbi:hypothetical protein SXCC_04022 [Gluconacetobacter sp. SXCC-1]|nr:hypothetical protein SXCC_04022 [Gluconacetobacter sp. SXCC-1]